MTWSEENIKNKQTKRKTKNQTKFYFILIYNVIYGWCLWKKKLVMYTKCISMEKKWNLIRVP